MNSATETPKTRLRLLTGRRFRSLALPLAAAGAATATVASLGLGPSVAQADPGDTFVATGSSQLVQSEDLTAIQVKLDTETVFLNRNTTFSSCIGEGGRWTDVVSGSGKPLTALWSSEHHKDLGLSEYLSQAKTPAQAKRWVRTLRREGIRDCQAGNERFDFHYGRTESSHVGSGFATWALSYRGNETKPDGGVVVFRKGTNVGYIQVSGTFGSAEQTMESVAKVAVSRLYGE